MQLPHGRHQYRVSANGKQKLSNWKPLDVADFLFLTENALMHASVAYLVGAAI